MVPSPLVSRSQPGDRSLPEKCNEKCSLLRLNAALGGSYRWKFFTAQRDRDILIPEGTTPPRGRKVSSLWPRERHRRVGPISIKQISADRLHSRRGRLSILLYVRRSTRTSSGILFSFFFFHNNWRRVIGVHLFDEHRPISTFRWKILTADPRCAMILLDP